ncbi:hypothetical protein PRJ_4174 [Pseudomonas sp. XWY-1]|nr:hypothetical protein PRJ_4174 [Pseudomonas sp. XWY-1]
MYDVQTLHLTPYAKTCATANPRSPLKMRYSANFSGETPAEKFLGQHSTAPPPMKKTV